MDWEEVQKQFDELNKEKAHTNPACNHFITTYPPQCCHCHCHCHCPHQHPNFTPFHPFYTTWYSTSTSTTIG